MNRNAVEKHRLDFVCLVSVCPSTVQTLFQIPSATLGNKHCIIISSLSTFTNEETEGQTGLSISYTTSQWGDQGSKSFPQKIPELIILP